MDFELGSDDKRLQEEAVRFARERLKRDLVAADREGTFDRDGWRACAEFGVLAMPVPREYGGAGLGATSVIAVMEGLGYACRDSGLLFSMNAHLWTNTIPIVLYGTEEQKKKYLPGLSDGSLIGANAATEPGAGSDIFAMTTRAERQGDHYVVNGAKMFCTNAPDADVFVTYVTVNPKLGPLGITTLIIERDTPGLSIGRKTEKMGLRTSPMAEVAFENCRVPVTNRLGRERTGLTLFECSMEWERGCILANCLGAMRHLLDRVIEHARSRSQFGSPIGKYQSVANRIVAMKLRIDTCRTLIYRIGFLKDKNAPALMEAALAKLHVSQCYVDTCLDAIQLFGGSGYTTEMEIERELRNAVASRLYSGTSEIQQNIVAKCLGL